MLDGGEIIDVTNLSEVMERAESIQAAALELSKIKTPTADDLPKMEDVVLKLEGIRESMKDMGLPAMATLSIDSGLSKLKKLQKEWQDGVFNVTKKEMEITQ